MEQQGQFILPIYLTNITLLKCEKLSNNEKIIEEIVLEKFIVKGFTIPDIIARRTEDIFKKALFVTKLTGKQYFKIKSIELLSQHGCGVID